MAKGQGPEQLGNSEKKNGAGDIQDAKLALDIGEFNADQGITMENFKQTFTIDTALKFLSTRKEGHYGSVLKLLQDARSYCEANGMDLDQFFNSPPGIFQQRMENWMKTIYVGEPSIILPATPDKNNAMKRDWVWLNEAHNEYQKLYNIAYQQQNLMEKSKLARQVNVNGLPRIAGVPAAGLMYVPNGGDASNGMGGAPGSYVEGLGKQPAPLTQLKDEALKRFRGLDTLEKAAMIGGVAYFISWAFDDAHDTGFKKAGRFLVKGGIGAAILESLYRFGTKGDSLIGSFVDDLKKDSSNGVGTSKGLVEAAGGKEQALDFRDSLVYMGNVPLADLVDRYQKAKASNAKVIVHPDIDNNLVSPAQTYTAVETFMKYKPELAKAMLERKPPLTWDVAVSLILTENKPAPQGFGDKAAEIVTENWLKLYNHLTIGEGFYTIKPLYLALFSKQDASDAEIQGWMRDMIKRDLYSPDDLRRLMADKFTAKDTERLREVLDKGKVDARDNTVKYIEQPDGTVYAICSVPIETSEQKGKSTMTLKAFGEAHARTKSFLKREFHGPGPKTDKGVENEMRFIGAAYIKNNDSITVCYALDRNLTNPIVVPKPKKAPEPPAPPPASGAPAPSAPA